MTNQNIKKLVTAALLAAMTCVATMIIKIPTPTFGYIHPGDGFVLLFGVADPMPDGAPDYFKDYYAYYKTERGYALPNIQLQAVRMKRDISNI